MNPTDKVDDLLAKAGAQWRAGQPSAPEPDLDRITGAQKRRRWLVPTLAAASVAAIAAAALIVLPDGQQPVVAPPNAKTNPTPMIAEGTAPAGKPTADDLLVRNGDRVEVNGAIIAVPGQQPVYCPSRPTTMIGYAPGKEPAPKCPADVAVKLTGLDLERLSLKTIKGVGSGSAHLVGVWTDQTIKVEQQSPYRTPAEAPPLPTVPCAAPPGGWPSRPSNISTKRVQDFLDAKADQIYGPITYYPNGHSRKAPVVFSIGVAKGDLEAFRKTFEAIYDGNLCLHKVQLSRTDNERISNAVATVMQKNQNLGIWAGGGQGFDGDRIGVSMLAFTEQVKAAFAPVGLDHLDLEVAVKPLR